MDQFKKWAQREYGVRQRFIALLAADILVVILLPILILREASALDQRLMLPRFSYGLPNYLLGGLTAAIGWFFSMWSVQIQFTQGRGTPIPVMAAQKLVVDGPFTYCRNPMSLGIFLFYGGIGIWAGSISAVAIVLFFTVLLVVYIKAFEEKELEARFGDEYGAYKQETPFLIPRLWHRKK
ncbi:MAG TPA: isoprenylcysteine carboxylmethyltransferase family protein [Anaerolineae bacterium]|nr:isoprenylcysteine carboxylmethyltransferase family protein [Anaerolineae bacterium]